VPRAACRSSHRDKHDRPQWDSNLGPLTPKADALTTRPMRSAKEQGTKKHQDMITRIALQGPVDGILHEHFAKLIFKLTDCLADSQMLSNCLTFTFIDSLLKTKVFFRYFSRTAQRNWIRKYSATFYFPFVLRSTVAAGGKLPTVCVAGRLGGCYCLHILRPAARIPGGRIRCIPATDAVRLVLRVCLCVAYTEGCYGSWKHDLKRDSLVTTFKLKFRFCTKICGAPKRPEAMYKRCIISY